MAKTIVIGDVHGCHGELMDLLDKVGPSWDDTVCFVGDLIVKGPEDEKVLDFLTNNPGMRAVLGNHEYALLRNYNRQPVILKKSQKKAKKAMGKKFSKYMRQISSWPLSIPLSNNGLIVHAGLRPDLPLHRQTAEDLTSIRTVNGHPWYEKYRGAKTVIFGHWVSPQPIIAKKAIGLDTGCVYGGRLTALVWPDRKFISVPSREPNGMRGIGQ